MEYSQSTRKSCRFWSPRCYYPRVKGRSGERGGEEGRGERVKRGTRGRRNKEERRGGRNKEHGERDKGGRINVMIMMTMMVSILTAMLLITKTLQQIIRKKENPAKEEEEEEEKKPNKMMRIGQPDCSNRPNASITQPSFGPLIHFQKGNDVRGIHRTQREKKTKSQQKYFTV